jgi:pimeloyl-ACP methyl ester carboxylesterase
VYDEFGLLHENAEEFGLAFTGPPPVRRDRVELGDGRGLSALVWGETPPEFVLLHGGGQNAHTWDTVALALGCPLVAIDLPGHGHSDGPAPDRPRTAGFAADVVTAMRSLAPDAGVLVGMSLGGLTAIVAAATAPDLVRSLVLVDVLPGTTDDAAKSIVDFLDGPDTFDSFDDVLARTVEFNPTRSVSSLRRGILHNAVELDDGRWRWRHRRHGQGLARDPDPGRTAAAAWEMLAASTVAVMLVRGMESGSVVSDEQEDRLRQVRPDARIEHVTGAGHSVQGDQPVRLAELIRSAASG